MKRLSLILFCLFCLAGIAMAASIATTPVVSTLRSTDRIPIGRPGGTVAYTTTPLQLRTFANRSTAKYVQVPYTSNSACTKGQFAASAAYIYTCYSSNAWVRSGAGW